MSRIEEMIRELCPNGVEYKPLWAVTAWDKKFNAVERNKQKTVYSYKYLLANELFELEQENGDVRLLSTGEYIGWTTEELAGEYLYEGEVVTIPWGKSIGAKNPIKYYKGKFVTADNRIVTSLDTNILNNKYLYFWMMSQSDAIDKFYRGAGIKHPSMKDILEMLIPVPPLAIQNEIVNILDKFTELEAKLEAELEARRKQYEYYRNKLLTFNEIPPPGSVVKWQTMNEICDIRSGKNKIKNGKGLYPVYGSTGIIAYCDKHVYNTQQILIARVGANAGYIHIANGEYDVSDNTLIVGIKNGFNLRYLYYMLVNMNLNQYAKGGGQPLVTAGEIKNLQIPIPPLAEQRRIVAILDKFETLVNDISEGLPAEIAARRQQYEHYRDKLLTFTKATA